MTRTYNVETTQLAEGGTPAEVSVFTLELTTARAPDGTSTLMYRAVSLSGREGSDLSKLLVRAFGATPIELRLDATGRPVGLADWVAQRQRMTAAVRNAGRDLAIDTQMWERLFATWSEADAMVSMVDEVRLLALIQGSPDEIGVDDSRFLVTGPGREPCSVAVSRAGTRGPMPNLAKAFRVNDSFDAVGLVSSVDGWALRSSFHMSTQELDGDHYTHQYVFRLVNPPTCPGPAA